MREVETIVVGGGPAGASCARALREQGLEVLVLDKSSFPREKPCAGWVAGEVWDAWGVTPQNYPYPLTEVQTLVVSWKRFSMPIPVRLYAVRRAPFDHWLLSISGAQVETHQVESVRIKNGWFILNQTYRCRYLVGAGGTNCPVARTFFKTINPRPSSSLIVAIAKEIPLIYPTGVQHTPPLVGNPGEPCRVWFFYEGIPGYAWYLPKAGGIVNVGIGGKALSIRNRGRTLLSYWRQFLHYLLQEGLLNKTFASDPSIQDRPPTHGYYLWENPRILQEGNAFVIGDAAGLATADMGEGIANAVYSGILVAQAIDSLRSHKDTGRYSGVGRHSNTRSLGGRSCSQRWPELLGISQKDLPGFESRRFGLRRWSEPWPFSRILHFLYR